jgi:hypothetical protein
MIRPVGPSSDGESFSCPSFYSTHFVSLSLIPLSRYVHVSPEPHVRARFCIRRVRPPFLLLSADCNAYALGVYVETLAIMSLRIWRHSSGRSDPRGMPLRRLSEC